MTFSSNTYIKIASAGVIIKKDDQYASDFGRNLGLWLNKNDIDVVFDTITPDLDILIILGGDGTLLHIAEKAAKYHIPVLGINLGNLGFLTEVEEHEATNILTHIMSNSVNIENRMMLKASITKSNGNNEHCYGLNEIVINKGTIDRVLQLSTWANDKYITTYKADGLIFSTPTGSTAYNLSAGGPLVYPGLESILVTPICPFMLGSRPVLLPSKTRLTTKFQEQQQTALIIIDGKPAWEMNSQDILEVETADHPLQLVVAPNKDYFEILRNKLHWG